MVQLISVFVKSLIFLTYHLKVQLKFQSSTGIFFQISAFQRKNLMMHQTPEHCRTLCCLWCFVNTICFTSPFFFIFSSQPTLTILCKSPFYLSAQVNLQPLCLHEILPQMVKFQLWSLQAVQHVTDTICVIVVCGFLHSQ